MFFRSKANKEAEKSGTVKVQPSPPQASSVSRLHDQEIRPEIDAPPSLSPQSELDDVVVDVAASEQSLNNTTQLSQEELRSHSESSKKLMAQFGGVVSVFMRSEPTRHMTLAQIENLVLPGIVSGQCLLAEAQSRANGMIAPVAVVIYALVSDEVDQRLSGSLDQPIKLAAEEWRSGDVPWLLVATGDRRLISNMINQVQSTKLNGRQFKWRTRDQDGTVTVRILGESQ